ncbi:hypothetical protein ZWY2020_030521 [Hordeum vulgare]|nr:hypothetical protein ZWY2020_030521 [Hordeum vulgare]
MDPTGLLHGDVLANILGRLMPRSLAACRSVCKAWCNVVDAHGLLRKDLLPLSLAGIFVVYSFVDDKHLPPVFLSRPSFVGKIQGNLGYLDDVRDSWSHMTVQCNGLLLLHWGGVARKACMFHLQVLPVQGSSANPATRQWVSLPHPDRIRIKGFIERDWLTFDPTVSPHFEVFFMHCVSRRYENQAEGKSQKGVYYRFATHNGLCNFQNEDS